MARRKILFLLLAFSFALGDNWTGIAPRNINGSPGAPNEHYYSGNRRMVRINNTDIQLAVKNGGTDEVWKSTDTGNTWTKIASGLGYSSSMCSTKDSMIILVSLIVGSDSLIVVPFKYNENLGGGNVAHRYRYFNADIANSGYPTEYREASCATDSNGTVHIVTSWAPAAHTTLDQVWAFHWRDSTTGIEGPWQVSKDSTARFIYSQIDVDARNHSLITYNQDNGNKGMFFAKSTNFDTTWSSLKFDSTGVEDCANPSPLAYAKDTDFVFGQCGPGSTSATSGVYYWRSTNDGISFSARTEIEATCSYGDPSATIDTAGTILLGYRSSRNSGVSVSSCGFSSRHKIAISTNKGSTWTAVDSLIYPPNFRPGTRNQMRHQNFFLYGGMLTMSWMQYADSTGVQRPTVYDYNPDYVLKDLTPKSANNSFFKLLLNVGK